MLYAWPGYSGSYRQALHLAKGLMPRLTTMHARQALLLTKGLQALPS